MTDTPHTCGLAMMLEVKVQEDMFYLPRHDAEELVGAMGRARSAGMVNPLIRTPLYSLVNQWIMSHCDPSHFSFLIFQSDFPIIAQITSRVTRNCNNSRTL